MASTRLRLIIFLIAAIGIGCLLGVGALVDILKERDIQRRFREERQRRED